MTITFPHPYIGRPDIKRYAVAGAAVLAMAVAFTGVRAAVTSDATTSTPTIVEASGLSTPADTLGTPASNYYNSLDSLGPIAIAPSSVAANSFNEADWMFADAGSLGVVPVPAPVETAAVNEADWMSADAGSLGVVPAPAPVETAAVNEADWMFADAGSLGVVPAPAPLEAAAAELNHLVSVNEIPWAPTNAAPEG